MECRLTPETFSSLQSLWVEIIRWRHLQSPEMHDAATRTRAHVGKQALEMLGFGRIQPTFVPTTRQMLILARVDQEAPRSLRFEASGQCLADPATIGKHEPIARR